MKQIGLSYFTDTHLTVIALALFFFVFFGTFLRVYSSKKKDFYKQLSYLPLEEEANERQ